MMMPDGGAPAPRPVQKAVTVDPGDIRDFARFLDEMALRAAEIEKSLQRYADGTEKVDFGAYFASGDANTKHMAAMKAAHANARALRRRIEELGEGTLMLARRYADTEDLNMSVARDIVAALDRKGA